MQIEPLRTSQRWWIFFETFLDSLLGTNKVFIIGDLVPNEKYVRLNDPHVIDVWKVLL
jgi:hypothetical protein